MVARIANRTTRSRAVSIRPREAVTRSPLSSRRRDGAARGLREPAHLEQLEPVLQEHVEDAVQGGLVGDLPVEDGLGPLRVHRQRLELRRDSSFHPAPYCNLVA